VRLKYGFVVECTGFDKDADGKVTAVHVNYFEDSKSGTPGADNYKVKGNITWVSAAHALEAEVRLYDRLFSDPNPDAGGKDFKALLNPNALETVTAYLEPGLKSAEPSSASSSSATAISWPTASTRSRGKPVFNRVTTLKDSWGK
jgi:glutaminyl-tRNA synthetase